MKRTFTFLMTALFLCVGMVKAAVTDFPQMSTDEDIKWYTISNTRSTSGKYLYWTEAGVKDSNTRTAASFFYVTGSTDACYIHNYATDLLFSGTGSWTEAGVACKLSVSPKETGLMIGFNNTYLNEQNFADGFTTWGDVNDDGSIFVFEEVTDFSAIIDVPAAKAAAVAEMETLASVSTLYPSADEAIAEVNAVEAAGTGLAELNAAVEAINAIVANYKAVAYKALEGKYFTIKTPARDNGFMKMEAAGVVGIAEVSSPAAIWQFEYANGAVNVYNPYSDMYLCEPAGSSEHVTTAAYADEAGAYDLVINAGAANAEAKVKFTSNGKSVHMDQSSVLVRWDNGAASEWTVEEITDLSEVIALHKAATLANLDEYAKLPSVFNAEAVANAKEAVAEVEDEGLGLVTCKIIDNTAGEVLPWDVFAFQATSGDAHRDSVWVSVNVETSKAIGATEQDANAHWMLEPASAGAFYLYNMANDCYMGAPGSYCPLTSAPMAAYTIEVIDAELNVVEFKCGGQTLHASNHEDDKLMNYDGDEAASRWTITIPEIVLGVTSVTVGEDVMEGFSVVATSEDMIKVNFDREFYLNGDPSIVDAKGEDASMYFQYLPGAWYDGSNSYIFMPMDWNGNAAPEGIYTITLAKSAFAVYNTYVAPAEDIVLTVQIVADPTGINNINAAAELVIYDLSGRRVEKMEKGIYIVNGKKVIK